MTSTDLNAQAAVADNLTQRSGRVAAFDGLTVRDYFAAAALTGILSAHSGEVQLPADAKAAAWAYEQADAMLKARTST